MKLAKTPLILTFALIPLTVLLRVVSVIRYAESRNDIVSYLWIALVLSLTVLIIVSGIGKRRPMQRPANQRTIVLAVLCIVSGAALLVGNLADTIQFVTSGLTPPPINYSVRMADAFLLICLLIFGMTGGLYLIYVGITWLQKRACEPTGKPLPALLPVLWAWFRLARYAVSYVSATGLVDTIYDYAYLIFCLLFLMKLAHFIVGDGTVKQSALIATALPTAWFGIACSVANGVLALLPQSMLQRTVTAGNMAGWVDFPLAVFALFLAADTLLREPVTDTE